MKRANRDSPRYLRRGAVAIFVTVTIVVLISFVSLAVDIGYIYNTSR